MTCIAAVAQGGKVWMAADSMACNDYVAIEIDEPKVFTVGELLFGVSGEHRVNQVIRFGLTPPPREGGSDQEWLVRALVPALRDCLREGGMLHSENGVERIAGDGTSLLLGYRGRIYRLECNFLVLPVAGSYFAGGNALEYALGSLHATERTDMDPQARVCLAVQAAARHGRGVREPITVTVG